MSKMQKKVPCKFHSHQYVTNFCNRVQCLVQLCPSCVCSHSQKHQRSKTLPSYEPIENTIKNCQNLITTQKSQIKKISKLVTDYKDEWISKKDAVSKKLSKAKDDTISIIEAIFKELQKSYVQKIEEEERTIEKKYGAKFENLAECCKNQEKDLDYYQRQLSESYSSHFIKPLYTEIIPKCEETMKKLQRDFSNLSKNQVSLEYRKPQLLNDIRNIIVESIALQLAYYEDEEGDETDTKHQTVMMRSNPHSGIAQFKESSPNIMRNSVSPSSTYFVKKSPQPYIVTNQLTPKFSPPKAAMTQSTSQPWRVYQ